MQINHCILAYEECVIVTTCPVCSNWMRDWGCDININNSSRSNNNNTTVLLIIQDRFLTLNFSYASDSQPSPAGSTDFQFLCHIVGVWKHQNLQVLKISVLHLFGCGWDYQSESITDCFKIQEKFYHLLALDSMMINVYFVR